MHRHRELPEKFAALGLDVPILKALAEIGFKEPTDIQRDMIPLVLEGHDILGQAKTGTGKTAAFGLPILQLIDTHERLQAIILTPTRELAAQVVGELRRLADGLDVHCVPIYGGTPINAQIRQLGKRPHVVVGTPGRVLDLMGRGVLNLDAIRFAVLDEVDRMLDIGFRDDIRKILGKIRLKHQTIFVSATIEPEIKRLAERFTDNPVEVNVSGDTLTVESVHQQYCTVDPWDKPRLLRMFLKQEKPKLAIVFCNTKHSVRKVAKRLHAAGIDAREIHGDLVQKKREQVMERFRKHHIAVLVATDLAARGIDVHEVTHIINYDVPQEIEVYVHRIGRTARMGAIGRAITFAMRDQGDELTAIEQLINHQLEVLKVDGFEPSPPPRDSHGAPGSMSHGGGPAGAPAGEPVAPAAALAVPAKPSSLGGKFPVRRRRMRR